jgi:multidrug efflux pump subunit AcrA (membrane-fusion protein)
MLIKSDVSEDYIAKVKQGDTIEVHFPSYPGYVVKSTVFRTRNTINQANRNFEIQLKIENNNEMLKPNMLSVLRINDFSTPNALVVPSIIIKNDIDGEFVFIAKESPKGYVAEKVRIKSGLSYKDMSIVLEGLSKGDLVITEGYNMVTTGIAVSVNNM